LANNENDSAVLGKMNEKEKCKHLDANPSSDPSCYYVCPDCGDHLDMEFKTIKEREK